MSDDVYTESVHDWLDEREPEPPEGDEPWQREVQRIEREDNCRMIEPDDFHAGPLATGDPF